MERAQIKEEAKGILKSKWKNSAIFVLIYGAIIYLGSWLLNLIPIVGPIVYLVVSVVLAYNMIVYFIKFKRGEEANPLDLVTTIPANLKVAWKCVWGIFVKMWPYFVAYIISYAILTFIQLTANDVINSRDGLSVLFALAGGTVLLPILVPVLIIIIIITIPAIMKGLYYTFTQYIMYDSGNTMTGKEAAEASKVMMTNKRGKYFILALSFIGWAIVAGFVGGILGNIASAIIKWQPLISYITYIGTAILLVPYMQLSMVIFYESLKGNTVEVKQVDNNEGPVQMQ